MVVTIPNGSTYQPISVLVSGFIAYSDDFFSITYETNCKIDETSFSNRVDFRVATDAVSLHVADLNLDGKPDYFCAN